MSSKNSCGVSHLSFVLLSSYFIFNINLQDIYIIDIVIDDVYSFTFLSFFMGVIVFWIRQQYLRNYMLLKTIPDSFPEEKLYIIIDEIEENPWIKQVAAGIMIISIFLFSLITNLYPVWAESKSLYHFVEYAVKEFGYIIPLVYICFSFYGFLQVSIGIKKRHSFTEKINSILNDT